MEHKDKDVKKKLKELTSFAEELLDGRRDIEEVIEEFLIKMGAFFDVDSIVVKEKKENGAAVKCTYEWNRKSDTLLRGLERRYLDKTLEEWDEKHFGEKGYYTYNEGDDCPIVIIDKKVKSLIQIPVYNRNEKAAFFEFADFEKKREWTQEEIDSMKSICNYIYENIFPKRLPRKNSDILRKRLDRDKLTKLPNIDRFLKRVNKSISEDDSYSIVIISSDVANFKYINEKYGYNTGDLVLKKLASTIYLQMKNLISCCREYSDIFLIALKVPKEMDNDGVKEIVDKCNRAFLDEIKSVTEDTNIAINSGFAFVGANDLTIEEAVTGATAARKVAKDMALFNTSRCCPYNSNMIANKARTIELIASCDKALENNEFVVYLQPKVLCRTYEIVGAEALIRWKKSDGSFVYPDEFIPAFEANGCIRRTDYFVYDKVFSYIKDRLDKGLVCVPISMNVSRIHLFNNAFVEYIDSLLKKYEIPVELIEFELTESICLEGLPSVNYTLQWLKQMHIKISIDDFGSGYSSLEVLTRMPIDVLKLDKVFMKDELTSNDKIIISSIVEMARLLGLDVICEGVEEDAQRIFLIEACCDKLQGYIYSKPIPMEDFSKKLEVEKLSIG